MDILFIGDIVGKIGRNTIKNELENLKITYKPNLVIANGENIAGGVGITRETSNELFDSGIDVLTSGNHIWDKKEIFDFIDHEKRIVRPANYPNETPGNGYILLNINDLNICILNLLGRVFLEPLDCPFLTSQKVLEKVSKKTNIIIVDFHAEATAEKIAFAHFLDGKVSCVVGTHTHVQTADEKVLNNGTGYITDVGMTGPYESVIGVKKDLVIKRFTSQLPVNFETAKGASMINAVLININEITGKCISIKRINNFYN